MSAANNVFNSENLKAFPLRLEQGKDAYSNHF